MSRYDPSIPHWKLYHKAEAAWEAAKKVCQGSEFTDALMVFGACNTLGVAVAWAQGQYNKCVIDAESGNEDEECAKEKTRYEFLQNLLNKCCDGDKVKDECKRKK